jgi:hypothetical protein
MSSGSKLWPFKVFDEIFLEKMEIGESFLGKSMEN